MDKNNEFTELRAAITVIASVRYNAEMNGLDPDEAEANATVLPGNIGEQNGGISEAERRYALAQVAGRVISNRAILLDEIETTHNPVYRALLRAEAKIGGFVNRTYLKNELGPEGLIAQIRGNIPNKSNKPF